MGDFQGHPFRGNQHVDAARAAAGGDARVGTEEFAEKVRALAATGLDMRGALPAHRAQNLLNRHAAGVIDENALKSGLENVATGQVPIYQGEKPDPDVLAAHRRGEAKRREELRASLGLSSKLDPPEKTWGALEKELKAVGVQLPPSGPGYHDTLRRLAEDEGLSGKIPSAGRPYFKGDTGGAGERHGSLSTRESESKVSPTQRKALATLEKEHAAHMERMKTALGGHSDAEEFVTVPSGIKASTVWALERAGKLEVQTRKHERSELIKGAFGRIGYGSKRVQYVDIRVRPKKVS